MLIEINVLQFSHDMGWKASEWEQGGDNNAVG